MTVSLAFALLYPSDALSTRYFEASRHFHMVTNREVFQWLVDRENLIPGRCAGLSGPKGA